MTLLDSIKGFFQREKVEDQYFGELEVSFDKTDNIFYLEKDIEFGPYKKAYLCLYSLTKTTNKAQLDLYTNLQENVALILTAAKDKYEQEYKTNVFEEYDVESINIGLLDNNLDWVLWLLKKKGVENCVIEFDFLEPERIYFSA